MNTRKLLDFVARLESRGNYNAVFGNGQATLDLSQFTLDQIHDRQLRHGKLTGSSAFGRYQILRKTLLHLRERMGLRGGDYFTPELQDELAIELMIGRGLRRWEAGRMSDEAFMDNLSKEWASLPYHTGRSFYDGDSIGNHALASRRDFLEVLSQVRSQ